MGLFSKPKVQGYDIAALNAVAENTAKKKRDIVSQNFADLAPVYGKFEAGRKGLSESIMPDTENTIGQFSQDLTQANTAEKEARNAAADAFKEQSFRDVPELQKAMREALGGSGLLNSGAARTKLADPLLDAARADRDFRSANEVARLGNETKRRETVATGGFTARQAALADKLGLDQSTIDYLTETGRGDILQRASDLLGVEGELGDTLVNNEQLRQSQEIAKSQAKARGRAALVGALSSAAGLGVGALTGNPMLGLGIGQAAGNVATGGEAGGFDALTLALLNRAKKAPVAAPAA